jgi:multiple sugar transport system permease protein
MASVGEKPSLPVTEPRAGARAQATRGRFTIRGTYRRYAVGYLFLLPAFVALMAVSFIPMLEGFWVSFQTYNLFRPGPRIDVGWDQYRYLLEDPIFMRSFWQSWYFALGSVVCQFLLGMFAAVLLNQNLRFRGVVRGLVLIPWVVPGALAAMMFGLLFTSTGLVNTLLDNIGLTRLGLIEPFHPWLSDTQTAMPVIIITNMWKGFPFFAVMFLAAMQSIPRDLYEAAKLDGASAARSFFDITIPSIAPTVLITTLLGTIWTFNSIDLIYILTSGGPFYSTMTLAMFAYQQGFGRGDIGYASAAAVVIVGLMTLATVVYLVAYRKTEQ